MVLGLPFLDVGNRWVRIELQNDTFMTFKELRRAWHTPELAGTLWAIILTYCSFFIKPLVVMNLWNWSPSMLP